MCPDKPYTLVYAYTKRKENNTSNTQSSLATANLWELVGLIFKGKWQIEEELNKTMPKERAD